MMALTVHQPYAQLIAVGEKRVENRTWQIKYRGRLAIHAGRNRARVTPADRARFPGMVFGAVVAVADLVECVRLADIRCLDFDSSLDWLLIDPHAEGPWCWILDHLRELARPVPAVGARGLFELSEGAAAAVGWQLSEGDA